MKEPGDRIEIGDICGYPIEPGLRWARVVGFLKLEIDQCGKIVGPRSPHQL